MKYGFIVEGHHDVNRIRSVFGLKHQFVVTNGTRFTNRTKMDIDKLIRAVDKVYILTDPDEPGDLIAASIQNTYPQLERLHLEPQQCKFIDSRSRVSYGVEYAFPQHLKDVFEEAGIL